MLQGCYNKFFYWFGFVLVLLVNFALFCKNLDDTIHCRDATTSLSARWRTTRWCWWSLDLNNMLSHFKSYLIILHHISLYHNIISHQSPHILIISDHIWSYLIICMIPGAGAGSTGRPWLCPASHHPLLLLPLQGQLTALSTQKCLILPYRSDQRF